MVFLNTTFSWKQTIIVVLTLDPIPSSNPDNLVRMLGDIVEAFIPIGYIVGL
jgi:hypothetical protein